MTKYFGSWKIVDDGIETVPGCQYYWISREDIMNKNVDLVNSISKIPGSYRQSMMKALVYAYKYFHAMTKYSHSSHPEIYNAMMSKYKELEWQESPKGYTARTSAGINITVFRNGKNGWKWVFDEVYSKSSYANVKTAKKKAYASYYWYYDHIKKQI